MKRFAEKRFAKSAKVHGVMTAISPMKQSQKNKTKYFDGNLSNGKSTAHFVFFDAKMHDKLSDVQQKKSCGRNCEVKEAKLFHWSRSGDEEVHRNSRNLKSLIACLF